MSETQSTDEALKTTFSDCNEWGCGGRFIYDPATNTRTRVQDTDAAPMSAVKNEAPVTAAGANKKEKANA